MDITNLKAMVSVMASLGTVGGKSMEDGKINVADLALLPSLVNVFPRMLLIDFSQVVPEAKDLTQAESEELVAHFKTEFDIPQDDIEVKIEGVLSICVKLSGLVSEAIALLKKPV
jgi:hypothetical protein